ncbi:MAG TPA: FAD binding domain-containing protein [Anaerolineales bacterium]|nr:FAD binding domain-containing protein [Anaerolineales bacterium]
MIIEYFRPSTLEEALQLLSKPEVRPLGGGTLLTRAKEGSFAVVDLQALGLNKIHKAGSSLAIGATVTLSQLLESAHIPPALAESLRREAPLNLRNLGTAAGTLVGCDGRSTFTAALLALDAKLTFEPGEETLGLGDFLPLRGEKLAGKLITKIELPLNTKLAFESVARTPADQPIVCVALAQWPSGRTRLTLGGFGPAPILALDGNEAGGLETAARNAFSEAGDEWASAGYRSEVAAVLARRAQDSLA